jgi:hypothetical protein
MTRPRTAPEWDLLRGLPRFEFYLRREVEVAKAIRCPIAFITIPVLYKENMPLVEESKLWITCHPEVNLDLPSAIKAMKAYNDTIRKVAADTGAILVDVAAEMPSTLEYMVDDGHPTRKGCELIANAILERVVMGNALVTAGER